MKHILFFLFGLFIQLGIAQRVSTYEFTEVPKVSRLVKSLKVKELPPFQQADVLFGWVIHNIRLDIKALVKHKPKPYHPQRVLRRKKALSAGYAHVYVAMLREAGIDAEVIEGYVRPCPLYNDVPISTHVSHWVAFKLDGEWLLADPFAGAGYVDKKKRPIATWISARLKLPPPLAKSYFVSFPDSSYGKMNPEELLPDKLALVHAWQLAADTLPFPVFEAGFIPSAAYLNSRGEPDTFNFQWDIRQYQNRTRGLNAYFLGKGACRSNPRNELAKARGLLVYAGEQQETISQLVDSVKEEPLDRMQDILREAAQDLGKANNVCREDHRTFQQQLRAHNRARDQTLRTMQQTHQRHQRMENKVRNWQQRERKFLLRTQKQGRKIGKGMLKKALPEPPARPPIINEAKAIRIEKQWRKVSTLGDTLAILEEEILRGWTGVMDTFFTSMEWGQDTWVDSSEKRVEDFRALQRWFTFAVGSYLPAVLEPWAPMLERTQGWQRDKQQVQDSLMAYYTQRKRQLTQLNRSYLLLTRQRLNLLSVLYRTANAYSRVEADWATAKAEFNAYWQALGARHLRRADALKLWEKAHRELQREWKEERKEVDNTEAVARGVAEADARDEMGWNSLVERMIQSEQAQQRALTRWVGKRGRKRGLGSDW